jgi:hypothetical protein
MSAILDPLIVALVVLTALGILWRLKRRKNSGCAQGCGCNKK